MCWVSVKSKMSPQRNKQLERYQGSVWGANSKSECNTEKMAGHISKEIQEASFHHGTPGYSSHIK